MAVVRKIKTLIGVSTALAVAAFCGGCDQGAAAKPTNGQASPVVRGSPIRSDAAEPPAREAPRADDASAGARPAERNAGAEPGPSKASEPPKINPGYTGSLDAAAEKPAPLAKPDISSFTRPKVLPKDDKTPVGVQDKDRPDILCVNFDQLASFEYDPYETVPPDLSSSSSKLSLEASTSTHKVVEDEIAGPDVKPPPQPVLNQQIPNRIMALNKKKIIIQGFMVPIEFKRDAVRSFLLVRNQMMCCFGAMMGMNEWVLVQMDGEKKTSYVQDVPTTVMGELEVGEDFQNGMVMSIYRLRAFEVTFKGGR